LVLFVVDAASIGGALRYHHERGGRVYLAGLCIDGEGGEHVTSTMSFIAAATASLSVLLLRSLLPIRPGKCADDSAAGADHARTEGWRTGVASSNASTFISAS
jgi:hypothetical protein